MLTTTLNKLRQHNPCADGWRTLLKHLGKTEADDEVLPLEVILESNGLEHALWALRAVGGHQNVMRLYACFCARYSLKYYEREFPDDNRPRQAIETTERYAHGAATREELDAAWDAAWDAAREAAWAAASAAAREAASAAARAAAWDAARDAARAAVSAAACDAARDAARAADWDAARAAARAAFRAEFIRLCRLEGEYGEVDTLRPCLRRHYACRQNHSQAAG